MNKEQFLAAIKDRISGLPQSDIDKSLDYYGEMIDDYIEEGLTSEEAVAAMGTVEEIASQILIDTPLPKLMKAKVCPTRALRIWEIVLLVLGSPIWLSLLLAVISVLFSLYIVIWSFVIVLYAANLCVAVGALSYLTGSVFFGFTGNFPNSLLFFGGGLICAGITILLFFAFNKVTFGIIKLSKLIVLWVKSWFLRKGDAK